MFLRFWAFLGYKKFSENCKLGVCNVFQSFSGPQKPPIRPLKHQNRLRNNQDRQSVLDRFLRSYIHLQYVTKQAQF